MSTVSVRGIWSVNNAAPKLLYSYWCPFAMNVVAALVVWNKVCVTTEQLPSLFSFLILGRGSFHPLTQYRFQRRC